MTMTFPYQKIFALTSLLIVLISFSALHCEAEQRCAVLCSIASLHDQCERCKVRIPMRFGKRSSPPEELLMFDPRLGALTDADVDVSRSGASAEPEFDPSRLASPDEKNGYNPDPSATANNNADILNEQFFRILARSVRSDRDTSYDNDDVMGNGEWEAVPRQRYGMIKKEQGSSGGRRLRQLESVTSSRQKRSLLVRPGARRHRGWINASRATSQHAETPSLSSASLYSSASKNSGSLHEKY